MTLKTITLPRSKIVVSFDEDYSAADVIHAQKAAGKDLTKFPAYLMQRICTFDGAPLTYGDMMEKLRGRDYLDLVGQVLSNGENDEAGN
jgi:hypothetical protein